MRWLAAHQPNYLPYPGFFSKALRADGFLIADHLQFTQDQKRNLIETHQGIKCISLSVSSDVTSPSRDVCITDGKIVQKHWKMIQHAYGRYPFFDEIAAELQPLYERPTTKLADLSIDIIVRVLSLLQYAGKIHYGAEIEHILDRKNTMIVAMCKHLGYDGYISGQGAKEYIEESYFQTNAVGLIFNEYKPIKYQTPKGSSKDNLSILDPLFCIGPSQTRALLEEL